MFFKQDRLLISVLLIIAVLLPIGSMFLFLFARILVLFGDSLSIQILDGIAVGLATFWILDFVALVFSISLRLIYQEDKKGK